ncbi:hypothetical protein RAA17_19040 [Komagataeibacter rhaeticus]|nr:hypothetical protein [Komagataeibacter rhaeticus]
MGRVHRRHALGRAGCSTTRGAGRTSFCASARASASCATGCGSAWRGQERGPARGPPGRAPGPGARRGRMCGQRHGGLVRRFLHMVSRQRRHHGGARRGDGPDGRAAHGGQVIGQGGHLHELGGRDRLQPLS